MVSKAKAREGIDKAYTCIIVWHCMLWITCACAHPRVCTMAREHKITIRSTSQVHKPGTIKPQCSRATQSLQNRELALTLL